MIDIFSIRIGIKVIIFQDSLSIKPRGLIVFGSGSNNEFVKCNVAGTSFIAFHFTAMTKTNKFNGGDFLQVCTSLWELYKITMRIFTSDLGL